MNSDISTMVGGRWDQIRGEVQAKWGRLTGSDLDQVQGDFTRLVGLIEDKYGYSAHKAQKEVNRFLTRYGIHPEDAEAGIKKALAGVQRTASDYPWAFALVAVVLAMAFVGLIWKPFGRQ